MFFYEMSGSIAAITIFLFYIIMKWGTTPDDEKTNTKSRNGIRIFLICLAILICLGILFFKTFFLDPFAVAAVLFIAYWKPILAIVGVFLIIRAIWKRHTTRYSD